MSFLQRVYNNAEMYFGVFLIGTMILCLIGQVAVRIFTGGSLAWAEELSRFCFIWTVYIGSSLAAQRAAHVRVSAQFMLAPVRVRLFFRIVADSIWMLFNLFFAYMCTGFVAEALRYPETSPTLGWTVAYVEAVIPLSAFLIVWRTVELYIRHIRKGTLAQLVSIEAEVGLT